MVYLMLLQKDLEMKDMRKGLPFLKWIGSKRLLGKKIVKRFPKEYTSYHEVFLGGGAIFFHLEPKYSYLTDINGKLITTYKVVRDDVEPLIRQLKVHRRWHGRTHYKNCVKRFSVEKDPVKLAALFIYLNRSTFSGKYSEKKDGSFSPAFIPTSKNKLILEERLRACSKALKGVNIQNKKFEEIRPREKAFYYIDPPYDRGYTTYHKSGFGPEDQKRLAAFCDKIDRNGGYFMQSNFDTPLIRKLYKGYKIEVIKTTNYLRQAGSFRYLNEVLIRNYDS